MRLLVPLTLSLLVALPGCSDAHERGLADTGPLGPDTGPVPFDPCGPRPSESCTAAPGSHVCQGSPACFEGHWLCPTGQGPTTDACWCTGSPPAAYCTCSPSGWLCGDPIDAGPPPFTCPADTSTLVGTPCSVEGASCGTCVSPCSGPCDQVTCLGGTWAALDFGCADLMFDCGPSLQCQRWSAYCVHTLSDVSTIPDDWSCEASASSCSAGCDCFAPDECTDDGDGAITVTRGGA